MKAKTARLGPLVCRIVDDGDAPALTVVLCHGYGAPGTDLVGLAAEIVERDPKLAGKVRFVFPEAPLALDDAPFGGRAWWHIDLRIYEMAMRTGDLMAAVEQVPAGLDEARKKLQACLQAMETELKAPLSRTVVGGFSQGAMLATDWTLRSDEPPAALFILSGTLIQKTEWQKRAPRRKGLRVVQSHGHADAILPFAAAAALQNVLSDAGLQVEFVRFAGGHGIDDAVIDAMAKTLVALLPA